MQHRNAIATIRELTGRQYPALEPLLKGMDERQLHDFTRLLNDVCRSENHRCRGQARRMGFPGVVR